MTLERRRIRFLKMHGAGNDFIILDNREHRLPQDLSALAQRLCQRKYSIGADGVLVLENSEKVNFRMRYFNADGSRAAMCGNGGRCIAHYAYSCGAAPADMQFETDAGVYRAQVHEKDVRLYMVDPRDLQLGIPLAVNGKKMAIDFINTGVPHAVTAVRNIESIDIKTIGEKIRFHKQFAPAGTNVNMIAKKDGHTIYVRTYERGVEDETLACGTGVTASAIIATLRGMVKQPVKCITRGGETLTVSFDMFPDGKETQITNVVLSGPVEVAFKGDIFV